MASRSELQRALPTARCNVPTVESLPSSYRLEERSSDIDTEWLDDRTVLLPLWRVLRIKVTDRETLRTGVHEPFLRVKGYYDGTGVATRENPTATPSGSTPTRNALLLRDDFQPYGGRRPTSIQQAPVRRDPLSLRPPPYFDRRYRARH